MFSIPCKSSGCDDVSTVPSPVFVRRLGVACRDTAIDLVNLMGSLGHEVLNPVIENLWFLDKSAQEFPHESKIGLEEKVAEALLENGSAQVARLNRCDITEGQHSPERIADASMQFHTGVRYSLCRGIE